MVEVLLSSHSVPFPHLKPVSWDLIEFSSYSSGSMKAQALQEEVDKMLGKGALALVEHLGPVYCISLFLVQKATGGWRPLVNLSALSLCYSYSL